MNKLEELRKELKKMGLWGIIIPSNDSHFSEYIAPYWKCRTYISGFTGSAGTVVVTQKKAALWVDSRYFIQAENQCKDTEFIIQKIGTASCPTINAWIAENSPKGSKFGVDGKLYNCTMFETAKTELEENDIEFVASQDPFLKIWQDRPSRPQSMIKIMAVEISGESTKSKHSRLTEALSIGDNTCYIITALDEIAWLLNIRGADISYNPVVVSYAVVYNDSIKFFVDDNKILPENMQYFESNNIEVLRYDDFDNYLTSLKGVKVIYNPNKLDIYHLQLLRQNSAKLKKESCAVGTVNRMKSIKNKTEIEGFSKAMIEDGVAMSKFYCWLWENMKNEVYFSEHELGEKLSEFRSLSKNYVGESFGAIVAFGENGAMPHYTAPTNDSKIVNEDSYLLIDSGAQYLFGTTDMTRTVHYSMPTEQQKIDYTLVLQGMIDLTQAVFPINTRGAQIDILARQHLYKASLNYGHGTGHGVGHYLNVHEGPQSIRAEQNPEVICAGMVMSNEPAIYRKGEYGIRIENVIVCEEFTENDFGKFLKFKTLTLFPIDTTSIIVEKLSVSQRQWINKYHARVYDSLATYLTYDEKMWLAQRTKEI